MNVNQLDHKEEYNLVSVCLENPVSSNCNKSSGASGDHQSVKIEMCKLFHPATEALNDLINRADLLSICDRILPPRCYGDCTNIPLIYTDQNGQRNVFADNQKSLSTYSSSSVSTTISKDCHSMVSQYTVDPIAQAPSVQNSSSFSFKHFLSGGNILNTPSSTAISLHVTTGYGNTVHNIRTNTTSQIFNTTKSLNITITTTTIKTITGLQALQTATGARPKILQSYSSLPFSLTNPDSLKTIDNNICVAEAIIPMNKESNYTSKNYARKMKRSPRFSSFDSQASLVEYVDEFVSDSSSNTTNREMIDIRRNHRPYEKDCSFPKDVANCREKSDMCPKVQKSNKYVSHSFSSCEIPLSHVSLTRKRLPIAIVNENLYSESMNLQSEFNLNMTLNCTHSNDYRRSETSTNVFTKSKIKDSTVSVLSNIGTSSTVAVASALPDFVQDHWMESWYTQDSHVTSPVDVYFSDLTQNTNVIKSADIAYNIDLSDCESKPKNFMCNLYPYRTEPAVIGSQILPDFLSDGSIIHSSQRLADIAVGLPSSLAASPDSMTELVRLTTENERLCRQLSETQLILKEETKRANDLEQQLYENLKMQPERRTGLNNDDGNFQLKQKQNEQTSNHITMLHQQIKQLMIEVESLRREKESILCDDIEGAVGGYSETSINRSYIHASDLSNSHLNNDITHVNNAATKVNAIGITPTHAKRIAHDLMTAASNAEDNLRKLLSGVESLREMAENIQNPNNMNLHSEDCPNTSIFNNE